MTQATGDDGRLPVAVAPGGTREWICDAVVEGGGRLVPPERAQALVWSGAGSEEASDDLAALLHEHPHINWVQLPWAGVEGYARTGVIDGDRLWTSGKGVYAEPVAEHALALGLAGLRQLKRRSLERSWSVHAGISLHRGRVTIFGGGGIAREMIRLLQPFGCHITVVRRNPDEMEGADNVISFAERYEAIKGADLVVLALALTPETTGFYGEIELELMEPHAWLVNVARGEHVVTEDLMVTLREDTIGGAALDVTDPEPLPEGHPLWELPNCLITPHTANTEDMMMPLLKARISENVRRRSEGRSLIGVVDAGLGY